MSEDDPVYADITLQGVRVRIRVDGIHTNDDISRLPKVLAMAAHAATRWSIDRMRRMEMGELAFLRSLPDEPDEDDLPAVVA